jgi:hypothetical protein
LKNRTAGPVYGDLILLWGLGSLSDSFIEGRGDLGRIEPAHMEIDGGRGRGSVTQRQLDMVAIRIAFCLRWVVTAKGDSTSERSKTIGSFLWDLEDLPLSTIHSRFSVVQ